MCWEEEVEVSGMSFWCFEQGQRVSKLMLAVAQHMQLVDHSIFGFQ